MYSFKNWKKEREKYSFPTNDSFTYSEIPVSLPIYFSLSISFMNNLEMTIKRIDSICPRKRKFMVNYAVS